MGWEMILPSTRHGHKVAHKAASPRGRESLLQPLIDMRLSRCPSRMIIAFAWNDEDDAQQMRSRHRPVTRERVTQRTTASYLRGQRKQLAQSVSQSVSGRTGSQFMFSPSPGNAPGADLLGRGGTSVQDVASNDRVCAIEFPVWWHL